MECSCWCVVHREGGLMILPAEVVIVAVIVMAAMVLLYF